VLALVQSLDWRGKALSVDRRCLIVIHLDFPVLPRIPPIFEGSSIPLLILTYLLDRINNSKTAMIELNFSRFNNNKNSLSNNRFFFNNNSSKLCFHSSSKNYNRECNQISNWSRLVLLSRRNSSRMQERVIIIHNNKDKYLFLNPPSHIRMHL